MATIRLCLCALHTNITLKGNKLDVQTAQQHIIQINQYFKNDLTSIESEVALKTLFADDKGIVNYMKMLISFDSPNIKIITADILFLFLQLIESFPTNIFHYIRSIVDLCTLCTITTQKNADISIKTYQIFEKLLEIKMFSDQIEIHKIIEHLNSEVSLGDKISSTARQHIYNLFGVIAQHHPMYLKKYEDKLMNLFCYELRNQIDTRDKNIRKFLPPVAIGCLNGLTGFLNNFAGQIENHDYCHCLYEILKKLIGIVEEKKRHVINRTGLNLFQKHIQLFSKLIFKDLAEIIWFQKKLWNWCSLPNLEDKKIGLSSFEVLYKGASLEFARDLNSLEPNIRKSRQEIIKNMIMFLESKLCDEKLNFQEHDVVVRSIGWLSEPCINFLGEKNLIDIFTTLSLQAEEKYLNSTFEKKNNDPNAANYLKSLSLIIRNIKSLSSNQVASIRRLTIYCFDEFVSAQLKSEWQDNISNAIIISLYCVASSHRNSLNKYLKKLFYMGLIKSCSHRVAIDAEIVEEYTGHKLIKSTNYVPLWKSLLKAHQCHSFDLFLNLPITVKSTLEKSLMCSFMSSVLKIITKLDLFTNKSANELETEYVARKPSDFTALINLVQIYSEILNGLEFDIETSTLWLPYTLNVIINHSVKFPNVGSMYKMLSIILHEFDWCTILGNNKNNSSKEKIVEYVLFIMEYVHSFKGELQFCCLEMLMNLPSIIIKEIFDIKILNIIKAALIVGSTFLPLAKSVLNALKRWQQDLSKSEMDQLLKYNMPYLDLLLRTKGFESEVELDNPILKQMQVKYEKKNILVKQNKLIMKPETELEIIQIQILEFLAQLDMNTCLELLENPNKKINYPFNIINYNLAFVDCKINISFDRLLPRILELCQFCSNRQIRFIACEIFHAYITLYLGNNLILERSKPLEMEIVTMQIIPVVVKLACDMDNLVQQLFEPLAIGIVHYFASGIHYNSIYIPIVIDILMEKISDNDNEAVRDFSAKCIKEFLHWTLKEDDIDQKPSTSLHIFIKKIEQFCKHSDPNKQIGAVIAFNLCYSILRENETVINELWIQLLYYFVLILDSKTSIQSEEHVLKSINYLQREFLERSNLFNKICVSRKIPKSFHGTRLFNVVEWLLKYIGSPTLNCRSKCFDMAKCLSKNVEDHNSLKNILNSFMLSYGEKELINHIERNLNSLNDLKNIRSTEYNKCLELGSIVSMLINWLNQLNASLDCYTSLFKENMIEIELLKSSCSSLFQSIDYFLTLEELSLIQWLRNNTKLPFKETEKDIIIQSRNFNTKKNCVIIGIFKFVNVFDINQVYMLLDDSNKEQIYELSLKYIFGCDTNYAIEKLNQNKLMIARYIKNACSSNTFSCRLKKYLEEKWSKVELDFNTLSEYTVQSNFACGNQLLFDCNILLSMDLENIVNRKCILEMIVKYVYNNGVTAHFELPILSCLEHMIDFMINSDYKSDIIINIIMDKRYIIDTDTQKKIIFGQYFFSLFNKPITNYFLKNPNNFVGKLFDEYPLSDQTLNVILEVLQTSNNKSKNGQRQLIIEQIAHNIKYWEEFQCHFSWSEIYEFIDLSSYVLDTFRNDKLILVQKWICENLTNNSISIYHKCRLLEFLPKLVSSQTYKEPIDHNMRKCLVNFRDKYFTGISSKFKPQSIEFTNLITAFQKILTAMELSSSYLLFEVIVEWCIKDLNHICIERIEKSLPFFFKRLSNETQLLCYLFVYEKFRNEIISENRRQMIIDVFLIPMISYCRKNIVNKIYMEIIDFILKTINENLLANDSGKARHLLISKITCFKLIEEMFKFFTYTDLSNHHIIPYTIFGNQSKSLISQFITSAVKVRYSNVDYSNGSKEIKQLFRQLHCYSYNALVTIISNTEDDPNKYTLFLFNERPPKQFIWRNLVDCSVHHEFPIDFEKIPQRKKKIINIRKKFSQNIPEVYIDLSSHLKNTLTEDLGVYDYNNSYLRSNFEEDCSSPNSLMLSVELEMDNFNNHECMAHACAVIKYLTSENVIGSTLKPNMDMPDWMQKLKLTFCDTSANIINSKIFILKLITNCETHFEPYAKYWLSPIMQFILDKHIGNNLNYFIIDVVSMIVSWHNIAIPSTEDEKYLAKKMLCFLFSISSCELKNVFKHNLEFIKFVVENWKNSLTMEYDLILSLLKPNEINNYSLECGLHLIGIVCANGILPFNEINKNIFLNLLLDNLKINNNVNYVLSAEIFGMLLKIFSENSINEIEILQFVSSVLKFSKSMDTTKILSCLYCIHKHYPNIIDSYMENLFDIFEGLQGIHRTQCLEMLLNRLSIIVNPFDRITKLHGFFIILNDNGTDDQLICFKMIIQLIPSLHTKDLISLLKLIADIPYQYSTEHRKFIYDIMCSTYKIYLGDNNNASKQILEECKKVLLKGLMDNDDELRQNMFRFWADDKRLPIQCVDRFLTLLDQLYSPDIESHFLGNLVSLLLESCCMALDYNQKIFQYPLHDCEFEDYKLTVSWRAKNIATIPKYADTLANQLNYSNTIGLNDSGVKQDFKIKRTLTFQFQPTLVQTQLIDHNVSIQESNCQMSINEASISTFNNIHQQIRNQNSDNVVAYESDFIQNKKVRMLRNKSVLSKQCALKNRQINVKHEMFKKERAQKRESSVNMYRKYRIGDFPDIEITNASVIKPLIELAKRDNNFARTILSLIICEFKNNPNINQQYFESLNKSLTNMMHNCHYNPSLVGFILDTACCYPTKINLNPNKVTEVATSCGLTSLGALVLETSINNLAPYINDEHIEKKSKITQECPDDAWIKLAEIYKNMGELDVMEGIFQDKMNHLSCDSLKEALKAQQSGDWRIAQIKFKSILECNNTHLFLKSDKEFLFEEYYKCSENLSDWQEINKMLKSQTGENYENIWDNNWYREHLLTRILHSELYEILTGKSDGTFIETFSNWLNDGYKEEYILTHIASQACMIFLCCDNFNKAQLWCKLRMRDFLREWENLSPQYYKLRANCLLNLQTLSEIYYFTTLSSVQFCDSSKTIRRHIQTWQSKQPVISDSLLLWDHKILYRSFFFNKIKTIVDELPLEEKCNLKEILNKYEVESILALIENAINKNNFYVAKKYMNDYKFENLDNWKSDFILCRSKIIAMSSCYIIDTEKKLKCYLKSWSELDDIVKEQCSPICLTKIHLHTANISKNMSNILRSQSAFNLLSDNFKLEIKEKLKSNKHFGSLNEILQQIDCTIISNYKSSIYIALENRLSAETVINNYLMLAQYCLEELNNKEITENNQKSILFIESVLKAMKFGAKKASELFPIILQFGNLPDIALKETFISESQNVPEYMFLQWINQIIGCLDSPLITIVGPLLLRVSQVYPKAVQIPIKNFMEKDVYNNEQCKYFLKNEIIPIISDVYMDMFVKAISNVCCPFAQLLEYINNTQECMKTNCLSTVVLAFENIFKNCFVSEENQKFKGKEFKIINIYKDKLTVILDKFKSSYTDINDHYTALESIKKQVSSHKEEYYLKSPCNYLINYCPWLAQYYSLAIDTLEVPGQYSGLRKPNPENHITITSFKSNVQMIYSMRSPIKVTMMGNNGEKYSFLIKFGEDLRHDQRVEQLLQVINNTLSVNAYCCERQLSLLTYTVIPVSKILGMIEWMNNTVTLKNFICESFSGGIESGVKHLHSKLTDHKQWLSNKSVQTNILLTYSQATIEYNSLVTASKFKQLVQSIPADILRKSLLNMCHCAEMYVCLRSKFITSYSVLSICHWLLGIGDRHLNNTIVSKKTGHCIGIDFNFAFHTATSIQVIPELIPFRMSPHIVSLMRPLNLTGFIRETMVHTLKTLTDNQEILLSVMQVFINDPSADWIKIAKTEALRIDGDFEYKEIQWFPKKKILSCKDKMNGVNPIEILSRELESSSIPNDYKNALINILKSDSQSKPYKRSRLSKCSITPNQQVDCLLDIATDEHILGKAYGGLELWV